MAPPVGLRPEGSALMAYVYVLISSKDNNRYIGSTSNLTQRFKQHNKGLVQSTKNRRPLSIKYYQEFNTLIEAQIAEKKYKKSRGTYDGAIKNKLLISFRGVA